MQRSAYTHLILLLCFVTWGCREDHRVLPDLSITGQLKKKVFVAHDHPSQVFSETEYVYGPTQRLLKTESYVRRDNQRIMSEYTEYSYDNEGRQVSSAQYTRNASNIFELYAKTFFEYSNDLLVRETISYPSQVAVIAYEYAEGRLVKKSFLDGHNTLLYYTDYEYDGEGKLTGEINITNSGITTHLVRYTYRKGLRQERQTYSVDPTGSNLQLWSTIRYAYDVRNRLLVEKMEYINPLSSAIFPTIRYEYY